MNTNPEIKTIEKQIDFMNLLMGLFDLTESPDGAEKKMLCSEIISSLKLMKSHLGSTNSENIIISMPLKEYQSYNEFLNYKRFTEKDSKGE